MSLMSLSSLSEFGSMKNLEVTFMLRRFSDCDDTVTVHKSRSGIAATEGQTSNGSYATEFT